MLISSKIKCKDNYHSSNGCIPFPVWLLQAHEWILPVEYFFRFVRYVSQMLIKQIINFVMVLNHISCQESLCVIQDGQSFSTKFSQIFIYCFQLIIEMILKMLIGLDDYKSMISIYFLVILLKKKENNFLNLFGHLKEKLEPTVRMDKYNYSKKMILY